MDNTSVVPILARLRRQGSDDGHCEVKASAGGLSGNVWDSVSAFANTRPGLLLLGLSEAHEFAPAPGFDIERVRDKFVTGIGDGGTESLLLHPPAYRLYRLEVDGAPVLAVEIDENDIGSKPCSVKAKGVSGGSYKRVDDKDIHLSATEIFEMQQALLPQETDRDVVTDADETDLAEDLVAAITGALAGSRALRGTATPEAALIRLSALTKERAVRLGGLLALGQYPQQFYPRLFIDVTVHPANEKSSPAESVRFVDRVRCDGPLTEAIDLAVEAVARNLRTYSVVQGSGRTDQLEIPRDVLREAVANAVVHREYHEVFRGQPVTVDVFPDRVVVTNPGGLWGGKTLENLDDGTSRCRNQTLMQLLQSVPFRSGAGLTVEGQGGGVKLMISQMTAHALDLPQFSASADQVVVVLRRHGAEVPEHRRWLRELADRPLTAHEDAALVMARRHGTVSVERLHSDMRIDSDEARTLLRALADQRLLTATGPETYALIDGRAPIRHADQEVLDVLSSRRPRDVHELSAELGKSPNTLRPVLRRLVEAGLIVATAAPTSRYRRYLRAD